MLSRSAAIAAGSAVSPYVAAPPSSASAAAFAAGNSGISPSAAAEAFLPFALDSVDSDDSFPWHAFDDPLHQNQSGAGASGAHSSALLAILDVRANVVRQRIDLTNEAAVISTAAAVPASQSAAGAWVVPSSLLGGGAVSQAASPSLAAALRLLATHAVLAPAPLGVATTAAMQRSAASPESPLPPGAIPAGGNGPQALVRGSGTTSAGQVAALRERGAASAAAATAAGLEPAHVGIVRSLHLYLSSLPVPVPQMQALPPLAQLASFVFPHTAVKTAEAPAGGFVSADVAVTAAPRQVHLLGLAPPAAVRAASAAAAAAAGGSAASAGVLLSAPAGQRHGRSIVTSVSYSPTLKALLAGDNYGNMFVMSIADSLVVAPAAAATGADIAPTAAVLATYGYADANDDGLDGSDSDDEDTLLQDRGVHAHCNAGVRRPPRRAACPVLSRRTLALALNMSSVHQAQAAAVAAVRAADLQDLQQPQQRNKSSGSSGGDGANAAQNTTSTSSTRAATAAALLSVQTVVDAALAGANGGDDDDECVSMALYLANSGVAIGPGLRLQHVYTHATAAVSSLADGPAAGKDASKESSSSATRKDASGVTGLAALLAAHAAGGGFPLGVKQVVCANAANGAISVLVVCGDGSMRALGSLDPAAE